MRKNKTFISRVISPPDKSEPAWWFAFQEDKLLVQPESSWVNIPYRADFGELRLPVLRQHYLGHLDHRHCYTVELAEGTTPPEGMTFEGLRQVYGRMDEDLPKRCKKFDAI
jgi:NAD+ diphosphatase